jgi:DNA-3-methyladenine glycosylase I
MHKINQSINTKRRCDWAGEDPLMIAYHDEEWGVPLHRDAKLFELLILEGAQAGLSWATVLKKRENYRKAFDLFDVKRIAEYDSQKINSLVTDSGIIRNKLKIAATVQNAKEFLDVQKEFGSFDKYIWSFIDGKIKKNDYEQLSEIPAKTEESEAMSKDLLRRGFKFVGATICYAFMQAVGMVNDHQIKCFRYNEV